MKNSSQVSSMPRHEEKKRLSFLRGLKEELTRAGIDDAQEAEIILEKVLGLTRAELYLDPEKGVPDSAERQIREILEGRKKRVPLAYLFKEADFWQETLYVDERCLIPRPETEILVERVLRALGKDDKRVFSFLDIGTGSGAIAIAILRVFKNAHGTLLDISGEALEVVHRNLERYALGDRARQVQGDLFKPFSNAEKWDLIVSNPPYLSEKDWKEIQEELRFEPKKALDGGKDGLDLYRKIIAGAKEHLISGGLLALEVGQGQANKVSKWLHDAGYDNIQHFSDHLQVQRVVMAQRNS